MPEYTDPYKNDGIHNDVDPAVINVAIPGAVHDITDTSTENVCTPAFFRRLYEGSNQGSVTVLNEDTTDAKVIVRGGPCYIDYVFDQLNNQNPQNPQRDWRPIGIAFKKKQGDLLGPRGDVNLPMDGIRIYPRGLQRGTAPARAGSTLRIYDKNSDKGTWGYYLIVQDAEGKVALIDPEIQNEQ